MIENLLSRDESLERQILAQCLILRAIPDTVIADYFAGEERTFFDAMNKQWREFGQIDIKILKSTIPDLYAKISASSTFSTDSKIAISAVREHWQRREIGRVVSQYCKNIEDPTSVISKIENEFGRIKETGRKNEYNFSKTVTDVMSNIEAGMVKGSEITGYTTGIRWLDNVCNGLEKSKIYVIGGLKKTGKSRFMTHLAIQAVKAGAGVMINSLEMSAEQLITLAFAYHSGVNSRSIGRKISQAENTRLAMAAGEVNNLDWIICREKTIEDLRGYIQFQRQTRKIDLCFIDFIQRMGCDRYRNDRVREVEYIAKGLADISRELEVGIIALSQLSKDAEKITEDNIPDMSCLKESQGIAENADVIMMLHNPERHNQNLETEYKPQKFMLRVEQRYDVSGNIVPLTVDMRTCVFQEGQHEF